MESGRCLNCMGATDAPVCPHCGKGTDVHNEPHQLPAGTVLRDQYLIGRALGQGGFGITYLGWDTVLGRTVAVKEFYPNTLVNRDASADLTVKVNTVGMEPNYAASKERFLREAKALAKLSDIPQIVGIHACFQANNTAYIVMEFVRGMDLATYVRNRGGRLGVEETLRILDPVIRALSTVHRVGLVHRDISPDNIMLHPTGGAKLLDFGAVRAIENPNADQDLARSTEAILKPGFAPMEQYRTRGNVGPWSDEYALCGTVYYCLTGRVPPDAVSRSMGEEDVDWDAVPGLAPHQRAALKKGMSFLARDRFPDMDGLRAALFQGAPAPDRRTAQAAPPPTAAAPPVRHPRPAKQTAPAKQPAPASRKKKPRDDMGTVLRCAMTALFFADLTSVLPIADAADAALDHDKLAMVLVMIPVLLIILTPIMFISGLTAKGSRGSPFASVILFLMGGMGVLYPLMAFLYWAGIILRSMHLTVYQMQMLPISAILMLPFAALAFMAGAWGLMKSRKGRLFRGFAIAVLAAMLIAMLEVLFIVSGLATKALVTLLVILTVTLTVRAMKKQRK